MGSPDAVRWMLLIHQIPPSPGYLRVKVGRRLQALGSVAVKNSVYVLPSSDQALEDFQWVRSEIVAGGGDASVCEARFVEGLSDHAIEALFNTARDADFERLASEARALQAGMSRAGKRGLQAREQAAASVIRLRRRLDETARIDFFGAAARNAAERLLEALENRLRPAEASSGTDATHGPVRGRTWVTRAGVQVDRIASAWLVKRFIDPEARFRFVRGGLMDGIPGELRFDMFEAEFTHEGDQCTFEVLLRRFGLEERALVRLGEIVHDIDLKDGKFSRPEVVGIDQLIAGICMRRADDEARLQEGAAVLDALYEYSKMKP